MVSPTMFFCFFTIMVVFIAMLWTATITTLRSRRAFIKSLKGKHVFVTGGSSGIGLALTKKALADGAFVTLVSRSSSRLSSAVDYLVAELKCGLDHIHFEAADVRDFEALSSAIKRAHEWKAIDVMVCNAGLTRGGYLGDGKMEDLELTVNTNLMGTINALHTALPLLKAHSRSQPVSIVIIGSLSSMFCMYGHSVYTATKYALKGLAEGLRFELLPYNIKVSLICPGFTNTSFLIDDERSRVAQGNHNAEQAKEIQFLLKWVNLNTKYTELPDSVATCIIDGIKSGTFMVTTTLLGFYLGTLGRGFIHADSGITLFMETIMFVPFRLSSIISITFFKYIVKHRHLQSHIADTSKI